MEVVVAEAVLSAALELLVKRLASSDSWKYAGGGRVRSELEKWKRDLREVSQVLRVAENKQIESEPVREWLRRLRDLAYDMEDVLDEFGYHEMKRRNLMGKEADGIHGEEGSSSSSTSRVCGFFFDVPCCFTPMRNLKMGSKIEAITGRLEQISIESNKFGLDKVGVIAQAPTFPRPLDTSVVPKSEVYGRDADKQIIIGMLRLDDDPSSSNVSVVSIVGMGGMGKTTLARLVYDDAEETKDFTPKAWACVSDHQFDAARVTKSILDSIGDPAHSQSDFPKLQEKLREELKGKKFLLVLDDVWTKDPSHWHCLQAPFSSAARGSKIIVTTREKRVAEVMGSAERNLHELKRLSKEECWQVFMRHSNIDDQSPFADIGKQIVEKCAGLPLAARALGGLLNQQRRGQWESVLNSPIWDLKESSIIPSLRVSYNYLPPHLKRCFAYSALFPKDYEFNKEKLILLWMAEGFIEQSDKELEDVGDDYFLELVSRSFLQSSASDTSTFVMHDLVHDLAILVSKETCLHLEGARSENDPSQSTSESSVRHLSYIPHKYDPYKRFEKFHKQSQLHTFINIWSEGSWYADDYYISSKVLEELIPRFECLRVLSLRNYKITEIPNSFGDQLKHLRYLDLSQTRIQWLPDSIGNLFYLQTLKLSNCTLLSKLPSSIGDLTDLRHLDISGENKIEEPSEICKLKNLRSLSHFIVGENNRLSTLGGMTNLGGELCISKLEKVVNIQEADAYLTSKQKLKSLIIKWGSIGLDESSSDHEESINFNVLRSLQPHTNLEKLRIEGYGGRGFPGWVGDISFYQKMVDLTLEGCRNCTSLPCLGQLPTLKRLSIERMSGVKKVGAEFYGSANRISFPSLEYLQFRDMQGWEQWEDSPKNSSFPCLQELLLQDCPELTTNNIANLPTCLPGLRKLDICDCPKLLLLINDGRREELESPLPGVLAVMPEKQEVSCRSMNNNEDEIMMRGGVDDHPIVTTTTSLTDLKIRGIPTLAKLDAGFVRGLRDLSISNCEGFTCLWDDEEEDDDGLGSENLRSSLDDDQRQLLGCNLWFLWISSCERLERLPNGWHKTLTCLEFLNIEGCPNLESFPEVGFPPKLRTLYLDDCQRLKCLPNGMMREKSDVDCGNNWCVVLDYLTIRRCHSLINILEGAQQLPTTLKTLSISKCDNLRSLPAGLVCAGLENLYVNFCPSLTDFPNNNSTNSTSTTSPFNTLKKLGIHHCENLKSLPEGIFMTDNDRSGGGPVLQFLEISDCPSLQSFPKGVMFPSTLENLNIDRCRQLELPARLFGTLSEIRIETCKNLELRPQQFQGFTRLTSLEIFDCENINKTLPPLSKWGLATLCSLRIFKIGGIFLDATSFSDHPYPNSLPTTLIDLALYNFPNLESIASLSLHQLYSLEYLNIKYCPKLRSILSRKKRLPPTLLHLLIQTSPLLEKRYSKEKGKDWSKIAHIPYVEFDNDL